MLSLFKGFLAGFLTGNIILWSGIVEGQEIPESDQFIPAEQQMKPANCWPTLYLLEGVKEQQLGVLWSATNKDDQFGNTQILYTGNTNDWVLVELNDSVACVLGSGDSFFLLNQMYNKDEKEL